MRIVKNREDILVCAHRGYMAKFPENSILAVKKALELKVDAIEIDLRYTKDKEIILLHDDSIDRTSNGTGLIEELTFEEIKEFNLLYPDNTVSSERIPTFKEYLEVTKAFDAIEHIIEIKPQKYSVELFNEVYNLLELNNLTDSLITTFDYNVTKAALDKGMLVQSFEIDKMKNFDPNISEEEYLKSIAVLGLFLKTATKEIVDKYKSFGLQMTIVPVDSDEDIKKSIDLGLNLLACNELVPAITYRNRQGEVI